MAILFYLFDFGRGFTSYKLYSFNYYREQELFRLLIAESQLWRFLDTEKYL